MLSEKVGAFRADRTEKVGAYRAKNLKKGVFSGAHTRTALLWEYPSPPGEKDALCLRTCVSVSPNFTKFNLR